MSRFRERHWYLRGPFGDLRLELGSSFRRPSREELDESRRELDSLLLQGIRWREPATRRVLEEIYAALRGQSVPDWGRSAPGPSYESSMEGDLRFAAYGGQLLVARVEKKSTAPVLVDIPDSQEVSLGPAPENQATKTTWFSLKVLDEVGDPIDGIDVAYTLGAQRRVVTTDGAGVARLNGVDAGSVATVSPASVQALREKLKPRWKDAREEKLPSGAHLFVRELDELVDPLSVTEEIPHTLVVKPFFRCYEVAGAHFAYGRSFVLRDGIQTLAELAEVVQGRDANGDLLDRNLLIAGHTDLSGGDLLNKELSERRAKAVQALFAHDFDAWEDLFSNRKPGVAWNEVWGVWEAQHMLNTLGVTGNDGKPLSETGVRDLPTQQAISRFRTGVDYPDRPADQARLSDSNTLGPDGRKELFLAYAKRVTRHPVDASRFVAVDGQPFVGCSSFNALSLSAKDAESRRVVVFVFDGAKSPTDLPCKKGSVGPCPKRDAAPLKPAPDPPYRCPYYAKIASGCPCQGGADLAHDLVVRADLPLKDADKLPHVFVLESDDGPDHGGQPTIVMKKSLATDARATDAQLAELHYDNVPEWHSYQLRVEGVSTPYTVMEFTPFERIHELSPRSVSPLFPAIAHHVVPPPED